jgi:hypothetical protein
MINVEYIKVATIDRQTGGKYIYISNYEKRGKKAIIMSYRQEKGGNPSGNP